MKKILLITLFLSSTTLIAQDLEYFGLGHIGDVSIQASSNQEEGFKTLTLDGFFPNENSASRFLSQATLGPRLQEIDYVAQLGFESWIDEQLALPNSFGVESYVRSLALKLVDSLNLANPGRSEPYTIENTFISDFYFDVAWFQGSMTSDDRLRWRVAFALSEIFVISRVSVFSENPYALSSYYDLLLNESFGNYRELIEAITNHPSMAVYLTFMNNHAEGVVEGNYIFPDENYAREIMQLFSIGLFELNIDGSEKLDANGYRIPTYDNKDIAELAKVFTGLSWNDSEYLGQRVFGQLAYTQPLKFFGLDSIDAYRNTWKLYPTIIDGHASGSKTFLGHTIPPRNATLGYQDIEEALDVIFNHPNVGPFIARRLIQRLVTSNPSPSYIERIANVFNDNGSGVRGDLGMVVKTILLDREARVEEEVDAQFSGMLREPFVRYTNLVNALGLSSSTGVYRNIMKEVYEQMGQRPLQAESVFNFFLPDYTPNGIIKDNGLVAPEFQLLNSTTLTGYFNALKEWLISNDPVDYYEYFPGEIVKNNEDPTFNLSADLEFASNKKLPILLDKYNMILAHGGVSKSSLEDFVTILNNIPDIFNPNGSVNVFNADRRVRLAIYLIMSSPEYLINR
jgi:uncharacterized protein (DUF1800 family)